jgi:cation diffusion facilitator CzcD-associated flavoprotein CzcO
VPAHAYSYSWEGNPRWSRAYVGATELYDYYKLRASQYGVEEFVRLNHRITAVNWDDESGKWIIDVTDLKTGTSIKDEAEVFINGAGFLK